MESVKHVLGMCAEGALKGSNLAGQTEPEWFFFFVCVCVLTTLSHNSKTVGYVTSTNIL